ncbi:MAG: hypothetical protein H7Y61_17140, partial [Rhizobiales bacterium]|nr:hypothetical protein [Rhizobacter sp.]
MTLTREHGIWAVAAAVLIAFAVWVARNTEWIDEEVRDPPPPALQRDPELRLKQVLTKLGAKVSAPLNLAELPPPGATLLLSSWNWNLFKEREAALQRWVEAGGALVVPHFGYARDGFGWVPITATRYANPPARGASASGADADTKTDDEESDENDDQSDDDSDDVSEVRPPARPRFGRAPSQPHCPGVNEPAEVTPAFAFARGYKTCMYLGSALQTRIAPTWALDGPHGHVIVRVPVGRGSVTASGVSLPFDNDDLLEHDNALIAAAVLRVRPGSEIWIVRDEARPPLLAFLWENGAPAVLLGCAALAFA